MNGACTFACSESAMPLDVRHKAHVGLVGQLRRPGGATRPKSSAGGTPPDLEFRQALGSSDLSVEVPAQSLPVRSLDLIEDPLMPVAPV